MDVTPLDRPWKQTLRRRMLRWFRAAARDLPWRQAKTLYHVWISEIMLQQTQVATVVPYFERFIERFPDIASLAAADEQEVLRYWEGLGYYRRARQLHHAAQLICERHQGDFPRDVEDVRALPGIGRYTAGAILSIALDAREPILEANTIRTYSRLLAFRGNPTTAEGQQILWSFAEEILPRKHVGDFNQSLMELGSEICTPRDPQCSRCPVASLCPTQAQGLQSQIPQPKKKTCYEQVTEAAMVVRRGEKILLRRCGVDERWTGLWDFPRFEIVSQRGKKLQRELEEKTRDLTGLTVTAQERFATIKHGVTRYRITLHCHDAELVAGQVQDSAQWIALSQLEDLPLSVTGRKIGNLLTTALRE